MQTTTMGKRIAGELRAEIARQRRPQSDVCTAWGMSPGAVSARLKGQRPLTIDQLFAACDLLGCDPLELMGRAA